MQAKSFLVSLVFFATVVDGAEIRTLTVDKNGPRYTFTSITFVDAPVEPVYEILVDYDRFDRLSSVITESRFLDPDTDGTPMVFTRTRGCLLFYCKTMDRVERLESIPHSEIVATVLPEQSDVKYARARWLLASEGDGTRIDYVMEFEPDFWVPPLIGPLIIKRKLRSGGARLINRLETFARESGDVK